MHSCPETDIDLDFASCLIHGKCYSKIHRFKHCNNKTFIVAYLTFSSRSPLSSRSVRSCIVTRVAASSKEPVLRYLTTAGDRPTNPGPSCFKLSIVY